MESNKEKSYTERLYDFLHKLDKEQEDNLKFIYNEAKTRSFEDFKEVVKARFYVQSNDPNEE